MFVEESEDKKYVVITIEDNGIGIKESNKGRLFDPFFTTKDYGTGIGLSVSRYIMRLHGGNLKHHTSNEWTVFSLIFNI